jgi:Metallo-peptidase family M12B Reprolysin-like
MPNFLDLLFGQTKKTGKDKLKGHQNLKSCDYGIKTFNKGKRDRGFVEEIRATEVQKGGKPPKPNKPDHPHGQQPPTEPPPSGNTTPAVLLLDFDGAVVSGTSWNYAGDLVLDYSGLTLAEQDPVIASVREDFSVFNQAGERVIVTTDPALYNAAPVSRRARCVITETWEWFGQAGGVSFINGFGNSAQDTAFVFSSLLGYSTKYIAEAISHELGHMFGCHHQAVWDDNCVKITDYNTGANGEAPIMGVAYYQPVGRWWEGTSSKGCYDIQNDVAIIGAKLG